MTTAEAVLLAGVIFPESTLHSPFFAIMAAFVAINTVVYSALAVAKVLPKVYPNDWVGRRFRRAETRGIRPEAPTIKRQEASAADPRPTVPHPGRADDTSSGR